MKFENYWSAVSYLEEKVNGAIIHDMSAATWDICKKEFLRILNRRDSSDPNIHNLIECLKKDVEREL